MPVNESKIRDQLACNLDRIERGLTLIKKEFPLPNTNGAGGFVDILARDPLGHYVIIEIKRSDQAARAALHELTKYVALLKGELGVSTSQLRAILVSTDWHELRIPFSEYMRVCEIPTEGYIVSVDKAGAIIEATRFTPPPRIESMEISHHQFIYLFSKSEGRIKLLHDIEHEKANHTDIDFAVLQADYTGPKPVIYKHAAYIVFSPCNALTNKVTQSEEQSNEEEGEECAEHESSEPDEEQQLSTLLDLLPDDREDAEIGYPEKLRAMASDGWELSVAYRSGRLRNNATIVTNEDLLSESQKTKGGAHYYIYATASPRFNPAWKKLREDCSLAINGNSSWLRLTAQTFDHIEKAHPHATVSVKIYNPGNIVATLAALFKRRLDYLPTFEIIVTKDELVETYVGGISWDGRPAPMDGLAWIGKAYGSIEEFMMRQHFHTQWERDEAACKILGLHHTMVVPDAGGKADFDQIFSADGTARPRHSVNLKWVWDFPEANPLFGRSLLDLIGRISTGWIED